MFYIYRKKLFINFILYDSMLKLYVNNYIIIPIQKTLIKKRKKEREKEKKVIYIKNEK